MRTLSYRTHRYRQSRTLIFIDGDKAPGDLEVAEVVLRVSYVSAVVELSQRALFVERKPPFFPLSEVRTYPAAVAVSKGMELPRAICFNQRHRYQVKNDRVRSLLVSCYEPQQG